MTFQPWNLCDAHKMIYHLSYPFLNRISARFIQRNPIPDPFFVKIIEFVFFCRLSSFPSFHGCFLVLFLWINSITGKIFAAHIRAFHQAALRPQSFWIVENKGTFVDGPLSWSRIAITSSAIESRELGLFKTSKIIQQIHRISENGRF